MNADIEGALNQLDKSWRCFEHKGKPMSKEQVRAVLTYAKQVGYKTTSELKDAEVDEIIEKVNKGRFNPLLTSTKKKKI